MTTDLRRGKVSGTMTSGQDDVRCDERASADVVAVPVNEGGCVGESIGGSGVSVDDAGGVNVGGEEGVDERKEKAGAVGGIGKGERFEG